MTQQMDPTVIPTQPYYGADPATHGWSTPAAPHPGYPPPGQAFPASPAQPAIAYGAPAPGMSDQGRLWVLVGAVVAVVVVLGGVLGWLLLAPSTPAEPVSSQPVTSQPAASQPAASQPTASQPAAPAAPSGESPATAAAARQQLAAAVGRYDGAAQRFAQQAKAAARSGDKEAMRTAVTGFRTATYGYDAEIRRITFPNEQQTIVNTQLLPATGRLVTDLDQFADLDPATVDATGDRVMADLQTSMTLTQQVMAGMGG